MNNTSASKLGSSEGGPSSQNRASRQQQQIWMLQQLYPDNPAYNLSAAFRLRGELNKEALNRSFFEAVNLHEILHTCFQMDRGELKQTIAPVENITIVNEEPGAEHNTSQRSSINRYIQERVSAPFDLEKVPLIKTFLLRIANDDHLFLLVSHQVVLDHASMNYLLQYILEQYSFFSKGPSVKDPLKSMQYSDYVKYQHQQIGEDSYAEKLNYWENTVLKPDGFLDIPVSHTRPSTPTFEGEKLDCDLSEHVSAGINKLAYEMDIPVPTV